ncbi:MAG: tRNA (adenosine(37)-N6)-threonylcarbamoyltransferase complex dimerization subunit type 1 TsaB [Myxococcota bacterium]
MAAERPLADASAPLLLAIETAGRTPSAAVLRGPELLALERGPSGRTGAEALLPCIDATLARAGVQLAELDAYAVAVGPGSFTGLRVGVATVKGLAFGSEQPVAAVSTLAALAHGAPKGRGPALALLDARRGEFYAAVFDVEGDEPRALPPPEGVYTPEQLVPHLPQKCVVVGDGVPLCGQALVRRVGPGLALGSAEDAGAERVGRLGQAQLRRGETTSAARLTPRYIRRAQAEVVRTGQATE